MSACPGWTYLMDGEKSPGSDTKYFYHARSGLIVRLWDHSDGFISFHIPGKDENSKITKTVYPDMDAMPSDHDTRINLLQEKFQAGSGKQIDFLTGKYGNWEVNFAQID